jgi:energy-coupling factor transport system ATP-binding protein
MNARDVALIAVLLAAGTLLQYVISPLGLVLTPDVITAFFCLGIILIRPNLPETLGIGIAGGFLAMLVPGSILPWANLASGPAGAYTCYYVYESLRYGRAAPLFTTFTATLVSGCVFVAVVTVVLSATILSRFGDFGTFIVAYLPIIIGTSLLNAVIVQLLALLSDRVTGRGPAA